MESFSFLIEFLNGTLTPDVYKRSILVIGLAYFIPTFIAVARYHKNTNLITGINILLGWTVIGWLATFFWAVGGPTHRRGQPRRQQSQ